MLRVFGECPRMYNDIIYVDQYKWKISKQMAHYFLEDWWNSFDSEGRSNKAIVTAFPDERGLDLIRTVDLKLIETSGKIYSANNTETRQGF